MLDWAGRSSGDWWVVTERVVVGHMEFQQVGGAVSSARRTMLV